MIAPDRPSQFRVAAVQMTSGPDVADNCGEAARLIEEAAACGAGLVVLPEYFGLISSDERAKLSACEADGEGPLQTFLRDAARRFGVWLVGGSVPLVANDRSRVRNSTLVFDPSGKRVARYDKIHLFGFQREGERYLESATIEPGGQPAWFQAPCGPVGLSICYDLRFPELYRTLQPMNLWVVPAAFTQTTGQAHWEILLRARAIENQCFVLAAAQTGVHPCGRRTFGHSMLIDPWGVVVEQRPSGSGIVVGDMDLDRLAEVRESLPALKHRVIL